MERQASIFARVLEQADNADLKPAGGNVVIECEIECIGLVDSDTDKLEICECPEDVDWFLGSQSELEFATIIDCTLKKSRKCATIMYKKIIYSIGG